MQKILWKPLQLVKQSMSLAGVESTILSPAKTSHALLSAEERAHQGISDGLLRFFSRNRRKERFDSRY